MATSDEPTENAALDSPAVTTAASNEWSEYPGRTLGIVALVLAFFTQIPALIMGIIAWVWSNKAGKSNVPAKVAVAVSASLLVLIVLAVVGWVALIASVAGDFGEMGMFDFD